MRITKQQLRQIIREESSRQMTEGDYTRRIARRASDPRPYRRSADKMSEVVAGILGRPLEPQEYRSIYQICADIYDAGMIEEVPHFSR